MDVFWNAVYNLLTHIKGIKDDLKREVDFTVRVDKHCSTLFVTVLSVVFV